MIINITKKHFINSSLIFLALPMLWIILLAFKMPSSPPHPIKTQTHKVYQIEANRQLLQDHNTTKYNIHGDVIEYAEYEQNQQGNSILKQLKLIKYNVQGLYIGTMMYNHNNALIWSEENSYNDIDQITKITQTDYRDQTQTTYRLLFYDDYGNVQLSQTFDPNDNQLSEQKRTYTETGELISAQDWIYVSGKSKPIKKIINIDNQYNSRGQIIQSVMVLQEGKNKTKDVKVFKNSAIIDWIKYKNGRLVSHFKHKRQDSITIPKHYTLPPPIPEQTIPLEYDDSKRDPLANILHKPIQTVSFKYNKQNLPTKKVTRASNQVVEVIYYSYNDQDQLIKEKKQNKITRNSETTEYEYDHYNNPIKKNIYNNETLVEQHLYTYEYYRTKK